MKRCCLLMISLSVLLMPDTWATEANKPSRGSLGYLKNVFDDFPRQQVLKTEEYPSRIFGQIETADHRCTGTLIGPKHVLTAAHCLYQHDNSEWATKARFFPARSNEYTLPYGEIKVTKFFVHKNYLNPDLKWGFDYAVMELESPIGDLVGWAGFGPIKRDMTSFDVQIAGYPADKNLGTMWASECPATIVDTDGLINYRCDTYGGMSGSSLRERNKLDYVVGLHTYGDEEFNGGWLINEERFNFILSWKTGENISGETVIHENTFPPKSSLK